MGTIIFFNITVFVQLYVHSSAPIDWNAYMIPVLFPAYAEAIRALDLEAIGSAADLPEEFLLARDGRLSVHYIPFEHVNTQARVVVVGIAPGFAQWKNAMAEAQRQMAAGAPQAEVLRAARLAGAFSGAIRPNFVALLDAIGVQRWLGIASCASLFHADAQLVQVSAILRHPVFVDGRNYSGTPGMAKLPFLRDQVLRYFAHEAVRMPDALYIRDRILHGLPHPSGANAERVAYFLGRKERATLSSRTNARQIDAARATLLAQMAALTE
jgi:hypothetical protein